MPKTLSKETTVVLSNIIPWAQKWGLRCTVQPLHMAINIYYQFKRQGDDLIYSHKISLVDSLKSLPIHFTTIDNEPIEIAVDEIISPQTEKVLAGKGMPVLNDDPLGPIKRNFQRGKLIIKFDIEFPSVLSEEQRHALSAVLDEALEAETA